MDGRFYQGRVIRVEPAKMKKKVVEEEAADASGGYKTQKAKQLQKTVSSYTRTDTHRDTHTHTHTHVHTHTLKHTHTHTHTPQAASSHNWNMLFMRSDTVAEAVAKGHSLTKGELLDHESAQSLAVRMALGEVVANVLLMCC
jgi:ABC-type Zn2+ transport system substrate-binding protein/surface adhesin